MKYVLLVTYMLLTSSTGIGQDFITNPTRVQKKAKKMARNQFMRAWQEQEEVSKLAAKREAENRAFIPVSSFVISSDAVNYDYSKSIIHYLEPNTKFPLAMSFVLKKEFFFKQKIDAVIDCYHPIAYEDTDLCAYQEDIIEGDKRDFGDMIYKAYSALSNRKYDFLFVVKKIRGCIWVVENKKVSLYNMNDYKFYDPDEFIRMKCSDEMIREFAAGKSPQLCN